MGKWTDDQLQYLREHSRSQPAAAIAAALGRTEGSVRQKRRSLGLQSYHAGWTKAEEQFLQDQWGVMSIPAIAKRLNRSVEAVIVRKNRLGLGPVLFGGDYISMNQLIIAVCGSNAGLRTVASRFTQSASIRTVFVSFGSMSFGNGQNSTARSLIFPKWSRWRWARSLHG